MSKTPHLGLARGSRGVIPIAGWALVSLLTLWLSLANYDSFQLGTWPDDADYLLLSRALARGEAYGLNIGPQSLPPAYPFVFPLALTPFVAWAPDQLDAGKALSLAMTLLNMTLLFWGWSRLSALRSRWWALAAAALYGLSPHVTSFSHMVMSEPLFTSFVLLSLLLSETSAQQARPSWPMNLLLGLTLAGAVFTRTAGLALMVALPLRSLWRWRRQFWRPLAAMLAGFALFLIPVLALTSVNLTSLLPEQYLSSIPLPASQRQTRATFTEQIAKSAQRYATLTLRDAVFPVGGGEREAELGNRLGILNFTTYLNVSVAALVLVGALWSVQSATLCPSVLMFEFLYVCELLPWADRSARLFYPILPFVLLQFLWGVRFVFKLVGATFQDALRWLPDAATVVAALVLAAAPTWRSLSLGVDSSTQYARDARIGTDWLRLNSNDNDLVLAEEPEVVHLYSDHPVVPSWTINSESAFRHLAQQYGARYLLIWPELAWDPHGARHYNVHTATVLLPLAEALTQRGDLELAYESAPDEMVRIYRIVRP